MSTPLLLPTDPYSLHAQTRPGYGLHYITISGRPYCRLTLTLTDGVTSHKFTKLLPMSLQPYHTHIRDGMLQSIHQKQIHSKLHFESICRYIINLYKKASAAHVPA